MTISDDISSKTWRSSYAKWWQRRAFFSSYFAYFSFYFCRYNMPVAAPLLMSLFGWKEYEVGSFFTVFSLCYAIGQVVNGHIADHVSSRFNLSLGVLGSVIANIIVFLLVLYRPGTNAGLFAGIAILWGINGYLQSMGWPNVVKSMALWYPVSVRGKTMGLFATCFQFGGAAGTLTAVFLIGNRSLWTLVFLVPALIFFVVGIFYFILFRDKPESVGLPPVANDPSEIIPLESVQADNSSDGDAASVASANELEQKEINTSKEDGSRMKTCTDSVVEQWDTITPVSKEPKRKFASVFLGGIKRSLKNKPLFVVAGSYFMLNFTRYGFINWLPTYLEEYSSHDQKNATLDSLFLAVKLVMHPIAGAIGVLGGGWATDRFCGGQRYPVIIVFLLANCVGCIIFPFVDPNNILVVAILVGIIGLCTYGSCGLLTTHAAQDLGGKESSASAAGVIDGLGYTGGALAGVGGGWLISSGKAGGTNGYMVLFIVSGIFSTIGAIMLMGLMFNLRKKKEKKEKEKEEGEVPKRGRMESEQL